MHGHAREPWLFEENDYQSTYCPKLAITSFTRQMQVYAARYEAGYLPQSGGIDDQPHRIMQAIDVIRVRHAFHVKRELAKKRRRQNAP